jgi:hypothetical protein
MKKSIDDAADANHAAPDMMDMASEVVCDWRIGFPA